MMLMVSDFVQVVRACNHFVSARILFGDKYGDCYRSYWIHFNPFDIFSML